MVLIANTGSIAQYVREQITDIPSSIDSGTNLINYVEFGRIDVQNFTGETINSDNVNEKYISILRSMGCVYTLTNMIGARVDFDVKLGELNVTKVNKDIPEKVELDTFVSQANMSMKMIGRHIGYKKVWGGSG